MKPQSPELCGFCVFEKVKCHQAYLSVQSIYEPRIISDSHMI